MFASAVTTVLHIHIVCVFVFVGVCVCRCVCLCVCVCVGRLYLPLDNVNVLVYSLPADVHCPRAGAM